ncbi:MAG: zinc metallopeptidase [Hoeflea sp.]|uniref:zinc metallopeptidase n=1 Tax=Hoeflea sp. TaxID=1940281 RepID=UPI001DC408BB|nr:zinc metallopeptidase [Hoeflea sp.]MBU4530941.1 zinc metallopeptidase [Alphaproteobacteria bacterium]MBU4542716.1 zinc metallopeptidase [Alphaproteobacteria bacterium]MBU4549357.1 zinc metallopeptidase [Alphaproteobacteria bacterium]MBV1722833.1 zinc metallopeptidase [Hoeflea sp.]MBV1761555.1 zinc metallopeptidase [Hoeflea sp.]
MAFLGIIVILGVLAAIYAPQFWIGHVMRRHGADRPDFPGTGGEMAQHLVERLQLDGVGVEATDAGDHYDPESRTVRLSKANFDGASLTAVAVAAHEVGHALQHHRGERGLALRQKLVGVAMTTDRIASIFFIAAPVLAIMLRAPGAMLGMALIGIGLLAIRILVHLVTLPVEYDASFNKALPILREGGYLSDDDLAGARSVLKAAAFTYVAAALMSLLNLARWFRVLR